MDYSVRPSYFERHNNDCKDWEKIKEREKGIKGRVAGGKENLDLAILFQGL